MELCSLNTVVNMGKGVRLCRNYQMDQACGIGKKWTSVQLTVLSEI
jgi:hypothetical protein